MQSCALKCSILAYFSLLPFLLKVSICDELPIVLNVLPSAADEIGQVQPSTVQWAILSDSSLLRWPNDLISCLSVEQKYF